MTIFLMMTFTQLGTQNFFLRIFKDKFSGKPSPQRQERMWHVNTFKSRDEWAKDARLSALMIGWNCWNLVKGQIWINQDEGF